MRSRGLRLRHPPAHPSHGGGLPFPFLHTLSPGEPHQEPPGPASRPAPSTPTPAATTSCWARFCGRSLARDPQTVIPERRDCATGLSNTTWLLSARPISVCPRLLQPHVRRQGPPEGSDQGQPQNCSAPPGTATSTVGDLQKWAEYLGPTACCSALPPTARPAGAPQPYPARGRTTTVRSGPGEVRDMDRTRQRRSPAIAQSRSTTPSPEPPSPGWRNLQTSRLAVFSRIFERIAEYLYPGGMA